MIQFAKPRQPFAGADNQSRRHEINAKEFFNNSLADDGQFMQCHFIVTSYLSWLKLLL